MIAALRVLPYVAVAGAVWWVMDLRADLEAAQAREAALRRSMAAFEASRDQAVLARQVANAAAQREAREAQETARNVIAILTADLEECADAPIDPDLADILNRLRSGD